MKEYHLSDKDKAICDAIFEMDAKDAASTLIALLAVKVLQDNPTWSVAKARTENSVKGLFKIVWGHFHGSVEAQPN